MIAPVEDIDPGKLLQSLLREGESGYIPDEIESQIERLGTRMLQPLQAEYDRQLDLEREGQNTKSVRSTLIAAMATIGREAMSTLEWVQSVEDPNSQCWNDAEFKLEHLDHS